MKEMEKHVQYSFTESYTNLLINDLYYFLVFDKAL